MRASLLSVGGDKRGGTFQHVALTDTAWIHNQVDSEIRVGSTASLTAEDLLIVQARARDTDPRPFLVIGPDLQAQLGAVRGSVAALQPLVTIHPKFTGEPVLPFTPSDLVVRDGVLAPPAWLAVQSDGTFASEATWDVEALTVRARAAAAVQGGAIEAE